MKQLITRQPPLGWVHEWGPSNIRQQGVNGGHDAVIRFGRFRVLLRQRQLIADGVPIELGTRAFDVLLVLLKAEGSLVTKDELLGRVWPGIVVSEHNLKVQVFALRIAQGARRRPRCHPYRIRPRLPVRRRAARKCAGGRLSVFHASKAAGWPNFGSV